MYATVYCQSLSYPNAEPGNFRHLRVHRIDDVERRIARKRAVDIEIDTPAESPAGRKSRYIGARAPLVFCDQVCLCRCKDGISMSV